MDGLTATCCPDGSCDATLPTACDFSCELAVLAFVADCQTFFGIEHLESIMQPVIELCEAVAPDTDQTEIGYNPTLLTHYFSATFRPFCAVFSPFFRGFRLPGAKTERTGEKWRKMGEIWGRNGRETAVAEWRWAQAAHGHAEPSCLPGARRAVPRAPSRVARRLPPV